MRLSKAYSWRIWRFVQNRLLTEDFANKLSFLMAVENQSLAASCGACSNKIARSDNIKERPAWPPLVPK